MSTIPDTDIDAAAPADAPRGLRLLYWRFNRFLERHLPSGLYRRALIIVIAPVLLLQSIMAVTVLDRHWDQVTKVLSKSLARDVALVVAIYQRDRPRGDDLRAFERLVNDKLNIGLTISLNANLPPPAPKPIFSILDRRLTRYISRYVQMPFWLDTVGQSGYVDMRVQADSGVIFRFVTDQDRAYAANTYSFLLWMFVSSLILLIIAIIFLRNQIRPIVTLARAAQSFGMGRDVSDFEPRGAREVRQAGQAFLNMKRRIERHVEQRTAMLAGVSHDLRTILTRFRLELALITDDPRAASLSEDVDEMQRMLEGYIAFVRGDGGETADQIDIAALLSAIKTRFASADVAITLDAPDNLTAACKPDAFKRCVTNLVANSARFASRIDIRARIEDGYLLIVIDDDGPGIPADKRDDVFRPFVRLDGARNQDEVSTGLGLSIARDIAQSHGGDIVLGEAPGGGLRATIRVPV